LQNDSGVSSSRLAVIAITIGRTHGLIFISFRDYIAATHGAAAEQVLEGEPIYLLSEAYPDERFGALVERASEATGLQRGTVLGEFGVFTAETTFVRLYPALFAVSSSARAFLLTVEQPIHELVRTAIPNALPPKLDLSEFGEDGVAVVYTSPRRLCELLRGLVEGTARHYGETAHIDERSCMHRGDYACLVEARFEPS
jgi:Haem-NO-binding